MSETAADLEANVGDDDHIFITRKRKHQEEVTGLNLTAMMDVMTILLVYLIKLYSDAPENITLNDDLRAPASTAPDAVSPAVRVMISKGSIIVDDKPVLQIKDGQIVTDDPANMYAPLNVALQKRVDDLRAIALRTHGPDFDGILMVVADEDTPYGMLTGVLGVAGRAQFTSYRLTVKHK